MTLKIVEKEDQRNFHSFIKINSCLSVALLGAPVVETIKSGFVDSVVFLWETLTKSM